MVGSLIHRQNLFSKIPNYVFHSGLQRDFDHGFYVSADLPRSLKRFEAWMGSMDGLFCLKDVA